MDWTKHLSPGPWRQRPEKPNVILDADGRQLLIAFGPFGAANCNLIVQAVNAAFDVKKQNDASDNSTTESEAFAAFMCREIQAAKEKWAALTPEKRASIDEWNQFAAENSSEEETEEDSIFGQGMVDALRTAEGKTLSEIFGWEGVTEVTPCQVHDDGEVTVKGWS